MASVVVVTPRRKKKKKFFPPPLPKRKPRRRFWFVHLLSARWRHADGTVANYPIALAPRKCAQRIFHLTPWYRTGVHWRPRLAWYFFPAFYFCLLTLTKVRETHRQRHSGLPEAGPASGTDCFIAFIGTAHAKLSLPIPRLWWLLENVQLGSLRRSRTIADRDFDGSAGKRRIDWA